MCCKGWTDWHKDGSVSLQQNVLGVAWVWSWIKRRWVSYACTQVHIVNISQCVSAHVQQKDIQLGSTPVHLVLQCLNTHTLLRVVVGRGIHTHQILVVSHLKPMTSEEEQGIDSTAEETEEVVDGMVHLLLGQVDQTDTLQQRGASQEYIKHHTPYKTTSECAFMKTKCTSNSSNTPNTLTRHTQHPYKTHPTRLQDTPNTLTRHTQHTYKTHPTHLQDTPNTLTRHTQHPYKTHPTHLHDKTHPALTLLPP